VLESLAKEPNLKHSPRSWICASVVALAMFLCSVNSYSQSTPPDYKKTVCFLFGDYSPHTPDGKPVMAPDGSPVVLHEVPLGTAFFVIYPDPRGGPDFAFMYLVTAKHVLRDSDSTFLRTLKARLNLKDGSGSDFVDVSVTDEQGHLLWFTDEQDPTNEAAVFPLLPSREKFDYKAIPTSMFVTSDTFAKANVSEGDRVFFIGLLPQFYGVTRNYPVVRSGALALITDEKIPLGLIGSHHVYVAEVSAWPGNSGSPVFLDLAGVRGGSLMLGQDLRMLGILLAENSNIISAKINQNLQYNWGNGQNTGISYILPAADLMSVLDGPAAQAARDRELARKLKN
jgi:hypothetical protein